MLTKEKKCHVHKFSNDIISIQVINPYIFEHQDTI